ncbi:hypothetical protein ABENE_08420 [Asticcacaulis benevestitus DSM 16100 = ATCC BAA-896]|uniref:Uncharacterized protein n=1 Tax=Asticcacaulis benevestitus DSM 16100 = ATCC BAA-896 TaxID=1121022 RepID=V4PVH9_9CAUL|nr:hypothetical protein ABENE_08420 [Asticcacaulis benevestitus DSM 16100 = ATCC BAA-896]
MGKLKLRAIELLWFAAIIAAAATTFFLANKLIEPLIIYSF